MAKKAKKHVTLEVHGVKVSVPKHLDDDFEFAEAIADISDNDIKGMICICKKVFGKQYDAIKEAIRAEHGYVSAEALTQALTKVFEAFPKSGS